ncbi:MAG TPA: VOC family protein [Kofleriaceae bacterium]|nr:VOC family protein [Kofleriaceae bacterium]
MKLKYTILYVQDVAASLAFYEAAFGLATRHVHESGEYAELETGATTLAFSARQFLHSIGKSVAAPDRNAPVFEIAFETDDVAKDFERAVANGATPVSAPQAMPWGQTVSYVSDCDGYLVEICSPVVRPA